MSFFVFFAESCSIVSVADVNWKEFPGTNGSFAAETILLAVG